MKPKPRLSKRSAATVKRVRKAVAESDKRMNTYTPAKRAELEQYARDVIRTALELPYGDPLDPVFMLRTLHMAYQHVLDEGERVREVTYGIPVSRFRLSVAEQRELGRRLATYWSMTEEDVS